MLYSHDERVFPHSYLMENKFLGLCDTWCNHKQERIVSGLSKTFHYPEEGRGMKLSVFFFEGEGHKTGFPKEQKLFLSSPPPLSE